jgi:hypothetical protein
MGRAVARIGESRVVCKVFVAKHQGRRLLGRYRRRWEDNIKVDLITLGREFMEWIYLA